MILTEYLLDKEHERGKRAIDPFAVGSDFLGNPRKERLPGNHIAECARNRLRKPGTKALHLFQQRLLLVTLHRG